MEKFNIKNIKLNTKKVFYIEICKTPGGSPIILTLLVVKGRKKGPNLTIPVRILPTWRSSMRT